MALYSKVEYWNDRYRSTADQPPYEWYQNFVSLSHLLNPETLSGVHAPMQPPPQQQQSNNRPSYGGSPATMMTTQDTKEEVAAKERLYERLLPANCRVLVLGCGNSTLGSDLYEAGWTGGGGGQDGTQGRFVQVDFSPVVIEQMKQKYNDQYYEQLWASRGAYEQSAGQPQSTANRMEFLCCDVTQTLPFEDGSFDLIIAKGVFDAVLCSSGSVSNIRRMVHESIRLLDPQGGVFFVVSYGNPDNRVVFLEDEDSEIDTYWLGVSLHTIPSRVRNQRSQRAGGGHSGTKNDYVYICRKRSGATTSSNANKATSCDQLPAASTTERVAPPGLENDKVAAQPLAATAPADSKPVVEKTSTTGSTQGETLHPAQVGGNGDGVV